LADTSTVKMLEGKALTIREQLLRLCNHVPIHIGGDMSVCDVMTVIWQYAMKYDPQNPKMEERDRFILSKGHAAAVTSLNQALLGCYDMQDIFNEYATNYGRFGMHSCNLINPHVEVSTGSLGQGFSVAVGMAIAGKMDGDSGRVFTMTGDGELQEGIIWEAALSAAKHGLDNLIAIVDWNNLQIDGVVDTVKKVAPVDEKFRAFGWEVFSCDGHDMQDILDTFDKALAVKGKPVCIVAKTVKGKGVSFMEDKAGWHGKAPDDEQLAQAIEELGGEK